MAYNFWEGSCVVSLNYSFCLVNMANVCAVVQIWINVFMMCMGCDMCEVYTRLIPSSSAESYWS